MRKPVLSILISSSLILSGCATAHLDGYGTVQQQTFVAKPSDKPAPSTATGAEVGAGVGVAGGATYGFFIGGMMAGVCALFGGGVGCGGVWVGSTLLGAVVGGAGGAVVGGTAGYIYGQNQKGLGLFNYSVQPDQSTGVLTITQYSKQSLPEGTRVKIYEKKVSGKTIQYIENAGDSTSANSSNSLKTN